MKRCLCIGILGLVAALGLAVIPVSAQEEAAEELKVQKRGYLYDPKDRRDPFISLIKTPEELPRTGIPLQDHDVSQMRLVAIVWDAKTRYALFGLPDGKFYTVTEGELVGIHGGKVESILEDAVLIREFKPDFRGRLRAEDTYLRLRKEEGL